MIIVKPVWLVLTYLIASFPFGLLVAKACCGIDPRLSGSGNTGATNVARLCGTRYGVATLILDVGKGYLPVALAGALSDSCSFASLVALTAVVGHMYSVFLYGKGGKGVATTIGAFLALAPLTALIAVLLCVAAIAVTGYVSVGSLILAAALPVLGLILGQACLVPAALVVLVLIVIKHKANIKRLRAGQEKPWRRQA